MKNHNTSRFTVQLAGMLYLILMLVTSSVFGQANTYIKADDPAIQYSGRIDFSNPKMPTFSYSGVSIKATFSGTSVRFVMKDYGAGGTNRTNYYAVIIDGKEHAVVAVNKTDTLYNAASGLSNGTHTVELFKRTESTIGKSAFKGFMIEGSALLATAPKPTRKMEFIGDSWTCGYGNEMPPVMSPGYTGDIHTVWEDNYSAWGAVLARTLNAQYMATAVSGYGVYRNSWDASTTYGVVPPNFLSIHANEPSPAWNHANYIPDVVMIHLGTNDFAPDNEANNPLDSAGYVNAYVNFVKTIRSKYAAAKIIIVFGNSKSDNYPAGKNHLTKWRRYTAAIVSKLKTGGDNLVSSFEMSINLGPYGEAWHPSEAEHTRIANEILPFVKTVAGWQDAIVPNGINDPKIKYEGIVNPIINADSVVFTRHIPASYADASSGIVYFPCNTTRNTQTGVRIRFKTSSPTIKLDFSKRSADGYFIGSTPSNGFTVFADGVELSSFSSLSFTINNPKAGSAVEYEVTLPNLWSVHFKKITLADGYNLVEPSVNTKPKYAAFGTSISHGTGQYVNSAKTYPFKLAACKGWDLYNFAVAGSIVGWQLAYNVKGSTAFDVITVEQGFNDWASAYSVPLATVQQIYATFIDSLRRFQPNANIYCIAPITTTASAAAPKYTLDEFRTMVSNLVTARNQAGDKKFFYINGSTLTNASMLDDGVHLNVTGAGQLAAALCPLVSAGSTTHVEAMSDKSNITIYPNPSSDRLFIQSNETIIRWTITNVLGNEVTTGVGKEVLLDAVQAGNYILSIQAGADTVRTHFIKQ